MSLLPWESMGGECLGGIMDRTAASIFFVISTSMMRLSGGDNRMSCDQVFTSEKGETGNFSSPGYPAAYPANVYCRYTFQGTPDERIQIWFHDFQLKPGTDAGCLFDYVDIFTIDDKQTKNHEDRFCGDALPPSRIALQQTVQVLLKSFYGQNRYRGFQGSYRFVDERWLPFPPSVAGCGSGFLTGVGGELSSPGYPEPYPPGSQCTWMIRVERDQKIIVNFIGLDLPHSAGCNLASVSIYNGFANVDSRPAIKICGQLKENRANSEFKSIAFRIIIRFQSSSSIDSSSSSQGFRLVWTAVRLQEHTKTGLARESAACSEFHCKGGEYCIDTYGLLCNPLPRYCIARSLRCNSVANCGAYDSSDEDGCFSGTLLFSAIGLVIVVALLVTCGIVILCFRLKKIGIRKFTGGASDRIALPRLQGSPSVHAKRSSRVNFETAPVSEALDRISPQEQTRSSVQGSPSLAQQQETFLNSRSGKVALIRLACGEERSTVTKAEAVKGYRAKVERIPCGFHRQAGRYGAPRLEGVEGSLKRDHDSETPPESKQTNAR